jgi:transcriptional regulator with XRE-family HTH domain
MNIDHLTPHDQALKELGNRLARVRKQHGYIQAQLAREAGIGVATLKRMEGGQGGQLESWVKIAQALHMAESINTLMPEHFDSPMAEVLATRKRRRKNRRDAPGSVWGDEPS